MSDTLMLHLPDVDTARDQLTEKVFRFQRIANVPGPDRDTLFAEIWGESESRVRAQARRMLRNEDDVAEAVQEVGLRLLRKIGQFRGESSFQTWLHLLAFNDILRSRQKRGRYDSHFSAPSDPDAEPDTADTFSVNASELLARHELAQRVQNAIDQINPTYRMYVVLAHLEGMTNEQIRDLFGVTIAVVKNSLNRGRQQLADVLDDQGIMF